jgi:competence protein CoiA
MVTGPARVEASPGARGLCETCWSPVTAKCGAIVSWHWAHLALDDCDTWAEPDSSWHRGWQNVVPAERREVVMGNHRADLLAPDGTVVELQHSSLSPAEILEREAHYRQMVWVFDAIEAHQELRFEVRFPSGKTYQTFRWKHPRKSVAVCRQPVFLDLGGGWLFRLKKIHSEAPCGGWGHLVPTVDLVNWLGGIKVSSGTTSGTGTTRPEGCGGGTRRSIGGYQYHHPAPPRLSPAMASGLGYHRGNPHPVDNAHE